MAHVGLLRQTEKKHEHKYEIREAGPVLRELFIISRVLEMGSFTHLYNEMSCETGCGTLF